MAYGSETITCPDCEFYTQSEVSIVSCFVLMECFWVICVQLFF